MIAGSSHFLLIHGEVWVRDPFSSLSITPACDFEFLDVKIGKTRLCCGEVSPCRPCEHCDLSLGKLQIEPFLFFKGK